MAGKRCFLLRKKLEIKNSTRPSAMQSRVVILMEYSLEYGCDHVTIDLIALFPIYNPSPIPFESNTSMRFSIH